MRTRPVGWGGRSHSGSVQAELDSAIYTRKNLLPILKVVEANEPFLGCAHFFKERLLVDLSVAIPVGTIMTCLRPFVG